jgi:myotubularin-related protein 6/7/8
MIGCAVGHWKLNIATLAAMPENLYAYYHQPRPPLLLAPQGWSIYDIRAEFARQGVGTRTKAWRFCDLNTGYGVSIKEIIGL